MILTLATEPTAEPVTLAEAKTHCRVDTSDDDTYITTLIKAARLYTEEATNRALITQTWDWYFDSFPYYSALGASFGNYSSYAAYGNYGSFSHYPSYGDNEINREGTSYLIVPKPVLQSVTYIKYTDEAGTLNTWGSGNYDVDTDSYQGRIYPVYNGQWPTDVRYHPKAINIRFVSGYADSGASPVDVADNVPVTIKQAILLLVGHLYENREMTSQNMNITSVPMAYDALINSFRVHRF